MSKVLGASLLMGTMIFLGSASAYAQDGCATDFNGDGVTDAADFEILKSQMGANDSLEGYDPAVDLNADGEIDLTDLSIYTDCN